MSTPQVGPRAGTTTPNLTTASSENPKRESIGVNIPEKIRLPNKTPKKIRKVVLLKRNSISPGKICAVAGVIGLVALGVLAHFCPIVWLLDAVAALTFLCFTLAVYFGARRDHAYIYIDPLLDESSTGTKKHLSTAASVNPIYDDNLVYRDMDEGQGT
jgi:hypothetical protein